MDVEIAKSGGLVPLARILEPDNILNQNSHDIVAARATVHFATRVLLNVVSTGLPFPVYSL